MESEDVDAIVLLNGILERTAIRETQIALNIFSNLVCKHTHGALESTGEHWNRAGKLS